LSAQSFSTKLTIGARTRLPHSSGALNETEIYYGTLRESGKDRDREEGLSRTWIEVSQELCIVDLGARKALRNESPILGRSGWLVSSATRECTHYDLRDARGFA
jgi:hypothetical protein